MTHIKLASLAHNLPEAWRSTVIAQIGNTNLKIVKMDACAHPEETHTHDEALLVLEGNLHLAIEGIPSVVRPHELCVIPAGVAHAVLPESQGCLLIIDPAASGLFPPSA